MNNVQIKALQHLIDYCYEEYKDWNKSGFPKDHIYPIGIKPLEDYLNSPKVQNRKTILDFTD